MPSKHTTLLPPPVTYNGVLEHTIQNIDHAQGCSGRSRIPVGEVRRPDDQGKWNQLQRSSSSTRTIISNSALHSQNPPDGMSPANESEIVPETPLQGMHQPTSNNTDRLEEVLADRRQLVDDLNASTALVNNLRVRCEIQQADLARCNAALDSCQQDAKIKIEQALHEKARWLITSCASLGMSAVYIGWCWINRVEMEFIKTRRREMFGL